MPGELAFSCDILRLASCDFCSYHLDASVYIKPIGQPKLLVSPWKLNELKLPDTYLVTLTFSI